jgi:AraC family transcriptional regulator
MMMEIGEYSLAQKDGGLPTMLATGSAPGESGVSILSVRFQDGVHFNGTSQQHLILFRMSQVRIECRKAGRAVSLKPPAGSLGIVPAGMDTVADADESLDGIFVAVDPGQLALAAAEDSALEAQIIERNIGHDQALFDLARTLASESADDYPNGPLFWNDVASGFIDRLVACHTVEVNSLVRGSLGKEVLERLRDYVMAHLDEPTKVATLANIAGRSPFHFSRVFTRSVGVTPHRYIVHLRLQRAIELVRDGRSGMADIAACTGFADQSHLTRWVRRVHGVSLAQLVADPRLNSRIFSLSPGL